MATRVWLGTDVTTPNSWSVAANWSGATVPVNGDDVYLPAGNTVSITAGLNQSAVTLASLNVDPAFCNQKVGVGVLSGVTLTYLQIGATAINFPAGTGGGCTLFALDAAAVAGTVNVQQSNGADIPPLRFKGTNLTYNLTGGSVAVAAYPGETSTVVSARLSSGPTGADPLLLLGSGVTWTDGYVEAGTVTSYSTIAAPAVRIAGGTYDYRGTGAHTQLDIDAGTCLYTGTGTLNGNTNVRGVLDFRQDDRAKTVTNAIILHAGASLFADTRYVKAPAAAALAFTTYHCRISDVTLDLGSNVAMTAVAS